MFDTEPEITVGILSAPILRFRLNGTYHDTETDREITGDQEIPVASFQQERTFRPLSDSCCFELKEVVIGKGFHWERKENQTFRGALKVICEGDLLTGVNIIGIEEYLRSVISSEMNAASPAESLKAHAVISRSWLLRQILNKKTPDSLLSEPDPVSPKDNPTADTNNLSGDRITHTDTPHADSDELIRWFDREEHDRFDVCADDHCQRYQGITRAYTPEADAAILATRGEVLTYNGKVCDARYAKCCGGATEQFENVWEPVPHPYLALLTDTPNENLVPDLTTESGARTWIESTPEAFCNTHDTRLLSAVLNNYDQETPDFYRWQVRYTQQELSALIKRKLGIDFGRIETLTPVERGGSGRLIGLQITGTKRTMTIGKELVIRKALSESHLYSSAFVVDTTVSDGVKTFILRGAGWGHGVGLCQIGAAVMGSKGYPYRAILSHYYPGSQTEKIYP